MTNSKRIGGLLGPTLMVMVASEFPLIQPHLYDEQIRGEMSNRTENYAKAKILIMHAF